MSGVCELGARGRCGWVFGCHIHFFQLCCDSENLTVMGGAVGFWLVGSGCMDGVIVAVRGLSLDSKTTGPFVSACCCM